MKKDEFMSKIGRSFHKAGFQIKKHSPEILVVAGVVGAVVSAVMACKATTKINGILEEAKEDIDAIHAAVKEKGQEDKSAEDSRKNLAAVYARTGIKLAKLYAPSIVLGTFSITGILTSNNILRKRNMALAAAYATVDRGFREYRNRVVERFGEDVDRELKYDIKAKDVEEKFTDDKGKEKTVKKTIDVAGVDGCSEYARYFDEKSPYWEQSPEANLFFLRSQQNYANDLLKIKGHLTLNEVYENLGFPTTKAGMVVGWIYDPENPVGDNYVDFGIYETNRETVQDFGDGHESVILLDFNVDGDIYSNM